MKNFEFSLPTRIVFGADAEKRAGELACQYGKKALLVYGSERVVRSGLIPAIEASLSASGVSHGRFGGVGENPALSKVEELCAFATDGGYELMIAVGGGSIIDAVKVASVGMADVSAIWDYFTGKKVPEKAMPFGCVLTMAASASEANCTAVVTNDRINRKLVFGHPILYPRFSLLNPALTVTASPRQTAVSAVDIFSHSFERYFDRTEAGYLRSRLTASVMRTVVRDLPLVQASPENLELRGELMWAAMLSHSDMIGSGGVFACHEMSHILTEEYHIPHGEAVGMMMLSWCRYMAPRHGQEIAAFGADVFNAATAEETISALERFLRDAGLSGTLKEFGVQDCDPGALAEKLFPSGGVLGPNFEAIGKEEAARIFEITVG